MSRGGVKLLTFDNQVTDWGQKPVTVLWSVSGCYFKPCTHAWVLVPSVSPTPQVGSSRLKPSHSPAQSDSSHSRSRGDSPVPRKGGRSPTPESSEDHTPSPKRKRAEPDPLLTRTGGAYIPPAKLRMMQREISDKSSVAYQRLSWEALKKSINGLINKVKCNSLVSLLITD